MTDQPALAKGAYYLRGATVLDGTGAPPKPNASILIENGIIVAIEAANKLPEPCAGVRSIDLTGKFLLPGFVNVHDHVTTKRVRGTRETRARETRDQMLITGVRNALVNLREGFTTIRDAGSRDAIGLAVKRALGAGTIAAPRMLAVAQGLTSTAGYAHAFFLEVDTPLEARKAAGSMIKNGADWIKCMASIEWEKGQGEPISAVNMDTGTMKAAFDLAHHHGVPCMAHAICDKAIRSAIEAGVDTIEHGILLSETTAELMAKRELFLVPTLSGYSEHQNDWGRGEGSMRHGRELAHHQIPALKTALRAGVRVAFGSDTLGNLVDEVKLMQQAGLDLAGCVSVLTRNGAELLRLGNEIGTVEVGKHADLTVLRSNPLATADAFADVDQVILRGRQLDPAQLPI